jgi:hypothetical protein
MAHDAAVMALAARFGALDNLETFVTPDLVCGDECVRLVYHDPSGAWWFSSERMPEEDMIIACLGCLLGAHPELARLGDLPLDWLASRTDRGARWNRELSPADWGTDD